MKDLAIIRLRIHYLGIMGTLAIVGAVVLIILGHPVEGMAIFGVALTAAGMQGGAPRSADPIPPPAIPAPAPAAPVAPVEQVTPDTLVDWIASAEKWGPDNLEAH